MKNEDYKHWRRRWLRWHSRSLLAGTLVLQRSDWDTYLDEMLKTYLAYGDFTENEIAFIFRRVSHGIRRLASHLDASVCARRAQDKIRAQGLRLMTDAAEIFGQGF
ncbi:hypothetical protein BJN34_30740 [Cupriavidus necator]|uniref:Uncharacterized protein n=1 Tax=Cupriavidus necator TaxID=106590 RepID=A0A1U9UZY3_CUPNE|nr:hypothetical protein [Cupriavidus necator]AQV98250.1 hypothetical protein BJN34_30740 [Cupriavidus necator]